MYPNHSIRLVMCLLVAGMLARAASGQPALTLTNKDLPAAPSMAELPPDEAALATEAVQRFHALLADGNTTKALALVAGLPSDRAARANAEKKLADFAKAIAQGKYDCVVYSSVFDEDCAVAYTGRIALIQGSVWVQPEPMFLTREGDAWKILVEGVSKAPGAAQATRLGTLNELYRGNRYGTMEEQYGPTATDQERAEKVDAQRAAMWSAGGAAKKPPKLQPLM